MRVLIIGYIWPEPRSSAAGQRSLSWVRALRDAGWDTHFASPARSEQPEQKSDARVELEALGVRTHAIAPNDPTFDLWIRNLAPDCVVFERFMVEEQFGWRVAEQCPSALRILDTVDLHFLREARGQAVKRAPSLTQTNAIHSTAKITSDGAIREVAAIYRSDAAILISEIECALLSDLHGIYRVPESQLAVFGFSYDPPLAPRPEEERRGFAVIGNFRHEPNADGLRWLKSEIWPRIRARLPQAEIQVYGAYPSREQMNLDDAGTGFRVRGPAPDQYRALSAARVNLAPLRFGAGLKGKIADGWWCGTPCVTTEVGAEGMRWDGRFGGLVASEICGDPHATGESFAEAACRLYEDAPLRAQARETGYAILREKFAYATNALALRKWLELLRNELTQRRADNFIGQMLGHQFHRSTRYFSRWIEIKNGLSSPAEP